MLNSAQRKTAKQMILTDYQNSDEETFETFIDELYWATSEEDIATCVNSLLNQNDKYFTEKFNLMTEFLKEKLKNNTLKEFLCDDHKSSLWYTKPYISRKRSKLLKLLHNLAINNKKYVISSLNLLKKLQLKNSFAEDVTQKTLFKVLLTFKDGSTWEVMIPTANLQKTVYQAILNACYSETSTNILQINVAEIINDDKDIDLKTIFKTFFEFIATGKLSKDIDTKNFIDLLKLLKHTLLDYFIFDKEIQNEIINNLMLQFLQNNTELSIEKDLFRQYNDNCRHSDHFSADHFEFLEYYIALIKYLTNNFKPSLIKNPSTNHSNTEYGTSLALNSHYFGLSYLEQIGLNYVEVPGDGNCFYSSVLAGIQGIKTYDPNNLDQNQEQIEKWKKEIVEYIHTHQEQYYHQIIATALSNQPDATPEEITPELFSQYLEQFCGNIMHDWADDFSISILMIILNRPIYIISSNGTIINLSAMQGLDPSIQNQPPIFVHYNQLYLPGQPGHYNALIPANSNPTNLQEIIEALTFNTNQAIQDHSVAAPGTTSSLLFTPLMSQQAPMTLDDITTTTTAPSIAFSTTAPPSSSKKRKREDKDDKADNDDDNSNSRRKLNDLSISSYHHHF